MKYKGNSLKGEIADICEPVSGMSGQLYWKFQDLVIQHDQKFPKHACISFGSEQIDQLQFFKVGDSVQVNFRIVSKKNKDRWFTSLKAVSIRLIDPVEPDNYIRDGYSVQK